MISDTKFVIDMSEYGRPNAHGLIESINSIGFANFPDDRKYEFYYHSDDCCIYWDNDRGLTDNIWKG